MTLDTLKAAYTDNAGRANRLKDAVFVQFGELLSQNKVALGVPMEGRVKSWASIEEKIERKALELRNITDLDDLIGVRAILLFRSDIARVDALVKNIFEVVKSEDTSTRLGDAQFGYQSQHYIVRLPQAWLKLPSMSELGDMRVELQVRTLAQHIWAAASHKLQYKSESSVPAPLRRAIYRVSALLETVDLEFDRLLDERQRYIESGIKEAGSSVPLNVDSLASILTELLPEGNRSDDENYSELLGNLTAFGVDSAQALRKIIVKHKIALEKEEATKISEVLKYDNLSERVKERLEKGVFFTHVGLTRNALRFEFGKAEVDKLFVKKISTSEKTAARKIVARKAIARKRVVRKAVAK